MPRMSKSWTGPGPDDLGERADADAHELAALALLGLLLAQVVVADRLEGQLEGARIVARVVLPAGRRLVRELLGLDEVLHPELRRVLADLVGQHVDDALDGMDRLGHPERAAIGDAAGRLVGVDPVDLDEGVLEVVRAGDDVEQPGRVLGRIGGGVRVAVVGDGLDLHRLDLAGLVRADLDVDVVVTGERVRLQVLRAILDPLDRLADEERRGDRQDVARVDRHLAAEPAADVVGLDPDVLLGDGQPGPGGHERDDRPDGVRRLGRHVHRQLHADGIPVGDDPARLDRGDVDARDVDVLADPDLRRGEGGVGGARVAGLPVPDVVVLLVLAAVRAQDRGVILEGLVRVDDDGQRLVVDQDRGDAVGRGVAGRRDDRRDLLALVHDRVGRQDHLHVTGEGRHPVELVGLQGLAVDHGEDARDLERLGRVDALDRRVGIRAAHDVQPQLAGQVDVLDVLARAADEARVLLALDGVAHAPDLGAGAELAGRFFGRHVARFSPLSRPRPVRPRLPGLRPSRQPRPGPTRPREACRRPAGWP